MCQQITYEEYKPQKKEAKHKSSKKTVRFKKRSLKKKPATERELKKAEEFKLWNPFEFNRFFDMNKLPPDNAPVPLKVMTLRLIKACGKTRKFKAIPKSNYADEAVDLDNKPKLITIRWNSEKGCFNVNDDDDDACPYHLQELDYTYDLFRNSRGYTLVSYEKE